MQSRQTNPVADTARGRGQWALQDACKPSKDLVVNRLAPPFKERFWLFRQTSILTHTRFFLLKVENLRQPQLYPIVASPASVKTHHLPTPAESPDSQGSQIHRLAGFHRLASDWGCRTSWASGLRFNGEIIEVPVYPPRPSLVPTALLQGAQRELGDFPKAQRL